MTDRRLRELERIEPAGALWLRELQRSGRLTEEKLRLMAFCGHPGATELVGNHDLWKNPIIFFSRTNDQTRGNMEHWSRTLLSLAPSLMVEVSCGNFGPEGCSDHPTDPCDGPSCGGKVRSREIGKNWLGVLALVAAAKVALPIWARKQRRDCEGTGKRPILNHYDNTPTGRFDKQPCGCCVRERSAVERAETWLADPTKLNEPMGNPCVGDWCDMTEAWGGIAPLIWERFGQESYWLRQSMQEFVLGTNEATIRGAVEKRIIEWSLETSL